MLEKKRADILKYFFKHQELRNDATGRIFENSSTFLWFPVSSFTEKMSTFWGLESCSFEPETFFFAHTKFTRCVCSKKLTGENLAENPEKATPPFVGVWHATQCLNWTDSRVRWGTKKRQSVEQFFVTRVRYFDENALSVCGGDFAVILLPYLSSRKSQESKISKKRKDIQIAKKNWWKSELKINEEKLWKILIWKKNFSTQKREMDKRRCQNKKYFKMLNEFFFIKWSLLALTMIPEHKKNKISEWVIFI